MVGIRRLQESDIEKVRLWRNSDHVRTQLLTQDEISEKQQRIWWERVSDSETQQYFIFFDEHANEDIGLAFMKNISLEKSEAEVGIFIGNEKYLNTGRYAFEAVEEVNAIAFAMVNKLYCWIFDNNERAIRFNEAIGYQRSNTTKQLKTGIARQYWLLRETSRKMSR